MKLEYSDKRKHESSGRSDNGTDGSPSSCMSGYESGGSLNRQKNLTSKEVSKFFNAKFDFIKDASDSGSSSGEGSDKDGK